MRILVVQATRMGDVIQTTPLIRALRLQHPNAHIAVMVRRMGAPVLARNPNVNDVLVYDEDEMYLHCCAHDSDRLVKAYEKAEEYIERLRDGHFDIAYNCTHSISSAMLLKLAGIPSVVGAHLSDDWQFVLRGGWTNYFFTSVFHREYNALNLCDITVRFADGAPAPQLVFDVTETDANHANAILDQAGIAPGDSLVCLQLGASEENKRWAPQRFAELALALAGERRVRIVLLGVAEEAPLGEMFERHAPGLAVHLYGKTSLHQVAAILNRAQLLVTNDTGTMHVAAAVKCPVVLVSVGHVHFRETGPYGEGHVAVERRRAALGRSDRVADAAEEPLFITAAHVLSAVALALGEAGGSAWDDTVEVHRSAFAPDGFLEWYPVGHPQMTWRDGIRTIYRAMWIGQLAFGSDEHESLTKLVGHYTWPSADALASWQAQLDEMFSGLEQIVQRGIATTEQLLTALRDRKWDRAKALVSALTALDEEIRVYGEVHSATKPLVIIARYERDNLEGADPNVLAETTLKIYRDCAARCAAMRNHTTRFINVCRTQHSLLGTQH